MSTSTPLDRAQQLLLSAAATIGRAITPDQQGFRAELLFYEDEELFFEFAADMREHRRSIEDAIADAWLHGFAWIDVATAFAQTTAIAIQDHQPVLGPDAVRTAYATLCARGAGVGHEILAQLRAGFPRGAHARWRTLYELAVTARVLEVGNRGTASRYLAHATLMAQLKLEDFFEDTDALAAAARRINRRFTVPFRGPYGWASELTDRRLGIAKPNLSHLEELAGLDEFSPLHRLANHHVHAGSMGNVLLAYDGEQLHFGSDPVRLGPVVSATIATLADIGMTATRDLGNYGFKRNRQLDGLTALGHELFLMGSRYGVPSDLSALERLNELAGSRAQQLTARP